MSTEEAAPPLPSCSITHYENGSGPDIMVSPPPQEKPKRNGTRPDEARPTVESLLDELEGSVPSPRYTRAVRNLLLYEQRVTMDRAVACGL